MEVRSERSTKHGSGEIRAFCLGCSPAEQPPRLCHSKQAGHCSSSLGCEGSPPSKDTVTRVTRCGVWRGTAAQGHGLSSEEKNGEALWTLPWLVQVSAATPWSLNGCVEANTESGDEPRCLERQKHKQGQGKSVQRKMHLKNTKREVNLNITLQLRQLQDSGGAPGRKIFHIRKICCLLKCFRTSLLKPLLEAQNTIIAVTTATRSGEKDPHYVSHTRAAAESISWGRETTRMSMEDMWIMLISPKPLQR